MLSQGMNSFYLKQKSQMLKSNQYIQRINNFLGLVTLRQVKAQN